MPRKVSVPVTGTVAQPEHQQARLLNKQSTEPFHASSYQGLLGKERSQQGNLVHRILKKEGNM